MKSGDRERASLPDPLTSEQRRLCMSRIRATDTKPEMIIRHGLHALGLRYRLHDRQLPGTPDLVFQGRRAVIFVHGCFWHGHSCPLFRLPATRTAFWAAKIERNCKRDAEAQATLRLASWRILTVWECALRGRARLPRDQLLGQAYDWVTQGLADTEIAGEWDTFAT